MNDSVTRHNSSRDLQNPAPAALAAEMGAWLWARSSMLKPVWGLVQAISDWPGIVIAPDRKGMCLKLRGVVLGELRWNGRIDLPFGQAMRDRLVAEGMAARDPDQIDTERVVFDVRTLADVDHAVWLLRLAYLSVDSKKDARVTNGGL